MKQYNIQDEPWWLDWEIEVIFDIHLYDWLYERLILKLYSVHPILRQ